MANKYKSKTFIWFHQPNFYDSRLPKKKAIAHCNHMMFDLDGVRQARFFNWFDVQKRLGIDRFRLYFFRVNQTSEDEIRKRVGEHVEIFHTRLDKPFICRHYIEYMKTTNNSEQAQYLLNKCDNLFRVYFDWSIEGVFNIHEKVCTNDCLLNFKWTHEFTTNYDFDEFIFPRKVETNDFTSSNSLLEKISCDSTPEKYSLYDYAVDLTRKSSTPVAVLRFKHVMFFHNDHANFFKKLFEIDFDTK